MLAPSTRWPAVFAALALASPAHAEQWQPTERVKPYTISGTTGRALYESIGQKGPRLKGGTRTIAHTTFDLKWRRKYVNRGKACTITSAKPFLTITYTLPKPAAKLSGSAARRWKVFADGIAAHEKVHGEFARTMVDGLIRDAVGLRVENDPKCRKIRARILKIVAAAYDGYRAESRAFDRAEMSPGGNVQGLIAQLLNGG